MKVIYLYPSEIYLYLSMLFQKIVRFIGGLSYNSQDIQD